MINWLFEPLFKTETCIGNISNLTCHTEIIGLSPAMLITIGAFIGIFGIVALINKRKEGKIEKKND